MHSIRSIKLLALAAFLASFAGASDARALCAADGRVKVVVKLAPPPGQELAGVKVVLDYPEKAVAIPGFENQAEVKERLGDFPVGFLSAPNDTDTELIVAMVGRTALPAATIFTVDFDRCKEEPAVRAADFHCTVPEASNPSGQLVDGSSCAVEIIADQAIRGKTQGTEKSKTKRGASL